ncbi:glycosyltransferase family 4 protein [bacterium]|nr:glycosyltransferase family 4 protein [bacterium]
MRIIVATGLYPPEIGGPATFSALLEKELPERGFDVSVVPFRRVRKLPKIVRHAAYFFSIIKEARDADIVFALDPVSVGFPAACAALFLKKMFVIRVAGDYAWEQGVLRFGVQDSIDEFSFQKRSYPLPVFLLRRAELFAARHARIIIVPSEYLKKIVARWGISENRIFVIRNAFTPPESSEISESKSEARAALHIQGTVVMSAGRFVPWKGFEPLAEVVGELAAEFPDIRLYIIGDEPLYENILKMRIEKAGLADRVIYPGRLNRKELYRHIKTADVFVLNSTYEGLSHQLLEVAAIGTPRIATNIPGNKEVIEDGINGILVEPGIKSSLKAAIRNMLKNPDLAEELEVHARKNIDKFSIYDMITQYEKIFRRLKKRNDA